MKKGKKVILAQPAVAAPSPLSRAARPVHGGVGGGGEAHRARLRYHSLLQDYQELVKETEAKKKRLQMEKLKKQRLLGEVNFLRRRYKSMSENPSQTVVYRLKNPAMPPALRTAAWAHDEEHRSAQAVGSSSKGPSVQQRRQHSTPRASPVIDLNEACEPSSEEMEEFHGYQEPARIDKVKKYPLEGDVVAGPSDTKIPQFWDVRNSAGRAGKRKISWQDQLALRV